MMDENRTDEVTKDMDYANELMTDHEREKAERIRRAEIENKISRLKNEQNNCIDNMNYLKHLRGKMEDSRWELKTLLEQSFRHDYLGEIVVPDIFEGVGAGKIKNRFEESRDRMYEYTENLSGIIYSMEQQIARLQRHIGSLDAEIESLSMML